jgi:PAS domain S-box-containing protein
MMLGTMADGASRDDRGIERLRAENEELRRENHSLRRELDAVRKVGANLQSLIENTDDHVLFSDAEGMPVVYNRKYAQAMKDLLGIDMRPGLQPHTFLDEAGQAFWTSLHRRVLSGEKFKAEFPFDHDGRMRYFEVAYNPVRQDDRIVGFCEYTREITERKLAEQALISDRDRSLHDYEELFERMFDGFAIQEVIRDEAGQVVDYRILAVNPAFEKIIGLEREQVVGRTARELVPDVEESWIEAFAAVAQSGEPKRFEGYAAALGKYFEVSAFCPEPGRFATVFQDVTARRRLEEQLRRTERLESIGVLAGGIAHDFNNILASLLASIQMARWGLDPDSNAVRMLEESEHACTRAGQLTKQLITFARGGSPIKKRMALGEVIEEWVGFALRGSSVIHRLELADDLWSMDADEGQIAQVVHNLVVNAAQAMPDGGTVLVSADNIETEGESWDGQRPCVRIRVKDHGVGIPSAVLTRVFDPYFTTKRGGSGLGLATSYSIVRDHGGFIRADSAPGKGSSFEVYLPATLAPTPKSVPPPPRVLEGRGRVLLMDDDLQLRNVTAKLLEGLGYSIVAVPDGAAAETAYQESMEAGEPFDAVLLDLTVPGGMGGKEAIVRLREIDPAVRSVVTSGYSTDPVMAEFREYGFDERVVKPFSIDELATALGRVLRAPKSER